MNVAKKALDRSREFVSDHKTAITIVVTATATAVTCAKLTKMIRDGYVDTANEFLESKGLMEEFTTFAFGETE